MDYQEKKPSKKEAFNVFKKALEENKVFYKDGFFQINTTKRNWGEVLGGWTLSIISEALSDNYNIGDLKIQGLSGKTAEDIYKLIYIDLSSEKFKATNKGIYFFNKNLENSLELNGFSPQKKYSEVLQRYVVVIPSEKAFDLQRFGLKLPEDEVLLEAYSKAKTVADAEKNIRKKTEDKFNDWAQQCHSWDKNGNEIF
ncbi:MAG: hypothetical protein JXR30_01330 [Alphaproteobacteria bacterium]|nr:hypothetical protein [Alphaproteobacteria bacterium]